MSISPFKQTSKIVSSRQSLRRSPCLRVLQEQEAAELVIDRVIQQARSSLADNLSDVHLASESYKNLMEGARNRTDMAMAEWAVDQQKLQMQLQAQAIKEKFSQQPKGPVSYGG